VHIPVLQKEILRYLDPKKDENFIDATIGCGGHARIILERNGPQGKLLGIEKDPELFKILKKDFSEKEWQKRLILVNDSYLNLEEIVKKYKFPKADGILFDLGLSTWHLKESGRGFSFQKDEPLDMRYDPKEPETAEKILNYRSFAEIEKILREYGEEPFAEQIARNIVISRSLKPIQSTFQLVEILRKTLPSWYQRQKRHFATRTFQALRIAVNGELNNLEKVLPKTLNLLEKKGRLVVVSFHSLEDRIVKNFFKQEKRLKILTKKPIKPQYEEIRKNPSCRSAKLRAAILN
jgi:16S rRNA (cytosine1402-N4)-methyltransferase